LAGLKPDKLWGLPVLQSWVRDRINVSKVQQEEKDRESREMGQQVTHLFFEQVWFIQSTVSRREPHILLIHT
jgi:hypothetical protein